MDDADDASVEEGDADFDELQGNGLQQDLDYQLELD